MRQKYPRQFKEGKGGENNRTLIYWQPKPERTQSSMNFSPTTNTSREGPWNPIQWGQERKCFPAAESPNFTFSARFLQSSAQQPPCQCHDERLPSFRDSEWEDFHLRIYLAPWISRGHFAAHKKEGEAALSLYLERREGNFLPLWQTAAVISNSAHGQGRKQNMVMGM